MARVNFGKGSYYDDSGTGARFLSAKDIEYNKPGSVSSFYGWNPNNIQNTWTKLWNSTDKNSKHIQGTINKYAQNHGININNATPQQMVDIMDFAIREEGRNQQNKGSFFGDVLKVLNPVNHIGSLGGFLLGGPVGSLIGGLAQSTITGNSPVMDAINLARNGRINPRTQGTPVPSAASATQTAATQRQEQERQAAIQRQQEEAAAQQAQARRDTARQQAFTNVRNNTNSYFTDRGLDPTNYSSYIDEILNQAFGNVPTSADNPGQLLTGNYGEQAANRARGADVDRYTTALNNLFTPGFSSERLPNSFDDDFLSQLLEEQFGTARQGFDRSYARGNLTDAGYNTAITELNRQREPAMSYLQDVGSGVLAQGRASLDDFANKAFSNLNNYQLGQNFSIDNYSSGLDNVMNDFAANYRGKIRGVVGNQDLFDTSTVQQRAGASQGVSNNRSGALVDALANQEAERDKSRGLGSQGVF